MSSPLADSPYALAREMERRSRTEQPRHEAAPDHYSVALQHPPRRTPEAQADIAAARAEPTEAEWRALEAAGTPGFAAAMQEVDHQVEQVAREVRDCAHAIRHIGCPSCDERHTTATAQEAAALDTALSNAALANTPAVREMGGPRNMQTDLAHAVGTLERIHKELWPHRDPFDVTLDDLVHAVATLRIERDEARQHGERMRLQLEQSRQQDAIVLTGPEAERYRVLQAAARAAHDAARSVQTTSAALRDAFQAMCAGFTPGKEG